MLLNWLHKVRTQVFSAVFSSFSRAAKRWTPWKTSNGRDTPADRRDNRSQREISGDVVNFVVEQEHEGFWTPIFVCQMHRGHFRRFLVWLQHECAKGQFDIKFEKVRVKRERFDVKPTWIYDGVAAWAL